MVPRIALFLCSFFLIATTAASQTGGWFFPYVEATTAEAIPLSLPVVPDGSGPGFSEAYTGFTGQRADATITLTLYSDTPGFGEPVAGYPREDIWLMTTAESFDYCAGGTIADEATDEFGVTHWSLPPHAGGWFLPEGGNEIQVNVSGWEVAAPGLRDLRFNSPDLSGDLQINLVDIALFAQDYAGPYHYRSDLAWDGVLNLLDVAILAAHSGVGCP